ncbi:MAG: L,D-transpeptidase family protein [Desulfobacterales bacterium]|jgi:murein L,D-transpeptidase YcbB/YkuD
MNRIESLSPFFAGILLLSLILCPSRYLDAKENIRASVAEMIQSRIEARLDDRRFTCRGELICGIAFIPTFYAERDHAPVWSTSQGPTPQALALLLEIKQVGREGLKPEDYHYDELRDMADLLLANEGEDAEPWQNTLRADFDLLMTDAAFLLGAHIIAGRVNPETIHAAWSNFDHEVDLVRLLNHGLQGGRLAHLIQGLHPPYAGYAFLRQALAEYRRIAEEGGWPVLDDGPNLGLGAEGPGVESLRKRLAVSGDLEPQDRPTQLGFDDGLEVAVKAFQYRHGLQIDGVVGKKTRQAMNVPVDQRIEQLIINMERWRWIPDDLGLRYLAINIADFRLTMVDQGRMRGSMRVVVGRFYRKTPVFSGTMTYLDFNPFWNIPRRLAIEDILPQIKKDPDYITRQGIRVFSDWTPEAVEVSPQEVDWDAYHAGYFPIRLQQVPGPRNALGRIKFMFPNKHAVYLHDTPAKGLFEEVSRDFSSGCIRVEDPVTLAEFTLEGTPGWDRETIENHLADRQRRVVRLAQPLPVHLLYWTAWSDDNGTVFFREDIYKRDAPLMRALKEKPAPQA